MSNEDLEQQSRWEPMRLTALGKVGDVVRTGGGKMSPSPSDPGEIRKPPGQE